MIDFLDEFDTSKIHFRDLWQIELKSEFLQREDVSTTYSQEFYFFIPNSLQINPSTYSRDQFYKDQINLIRYKTPVFTLREVMNLSLPTSPLSRIQALGHQSPTAENIRLMEKEIKLYGNIVRSCLRGKAQVLIEEITRAKNHKERMEAKHNLSEFSLDIGKFLEAGKKVENFVLNSWNEEIIKKHFQYVNSFIHQSIEYYITGLVERIREKKVPEWFESNEQFSLLLVTLRGGIKLPETDREKETLLYQKGLLKKYVLNALLLNINRFSPHQRYRNIIGGFAAGTAMLVYLLLFIWQAGGSFVFNSAPVVIFTVLLYILKDRIKEELRNFSSSSLAKWFADYTTEIRSPDDEKVLGKLQENFVFLKEADVPPDIVEMRNRGFHNVLESFKRPETVIYYKKNMRLFRMPRKGTFPRQYMLNIIFRFNIQNFLSKASDPVQSHLTLNPQNKQLEVLELPKVYHINMIIKTSYEDLHGDAQIEFRKFRLVVDKNGIKRVEDLNSF